ncbi:MAG: family 20 glycosylhydrolase, partial [Confluentibacter sp.]|nr:family 20 glycosylhydrolase [Confluentibacter sp.]
MLKKNRRLTCTIFMVFNLLIAFNGHAITKGDTLKNKYPIIPTPQEISYGDSELLFETIFIIGSEFTNEISQLKAFLHKQEIEESPEGLKIQFIKIDLATSNPEEAYTLGIDNHITISATTEKGAYYAIQTLKQLLRKNGDKGVFPKLKIKDWPAFKIRGFMHDTGRNFQSVSQLKEQIEIMSQYKYNVFHWHLTDNPGWRLESKLYPELQSETVTTRQKGNFYTQDDFKEVLAFCKERKITVIPELDIPGHTEAFRKALNIETMQDPKVKSILLDLFRELMGMANAIEMPYIH